LEIAGVIILITSAGGAYGAMIQHSGIGKAISVTTRQFEVHYLLLAWVIAAVMKIAQGSGTVAMITSSAIMATLIGPVSPFLIILFIFFWLSDLALCLYPG
jgi:GntP family gluconate:H+ symporter